MSSETEKILNQMSQADKLRLMEELWDSLYPLAEGVSSPAWHGEVLSERRKRVVSGEAKFLEWAAVKERLLQKMA